MAKDKEASQSKAWPKDKGKGKEAVLKAKESELAKPQAVAEEKKVVDPPILPPVNKEDPPSTKAKLRIFSLSLYFNLGSFFLSLYFFFLLGQFALVHNVLSLLLNEKTLLLPLWAFIFPTMFVFGWLYYFFFLRFLD